MNIFISIFKKMSKRSFLLMAAICGVGGTHGETSEIQRKIMFLQVEIADQPFQLEAMLYLPTTKAEHYPLVITTHGRNGPAPAKRPREVFGLSAMATELASHGYMVLHLVRRGYGNSGGEDSEFKDTAEQSGLTGAQDIAAVVAAMRERSDVQKNKIAVVGQSQGGWVALAASTLQMEGVLGVVNFSGAINFAQARNYGINTYPVESQMKESAQSYGKSSKVPVFWLYASNDNHSVSTVTSWFNGFQKSGGKGSLFFTNEFQPKGHYVVSDPSFYKDRLLAFLDQIGMRET